MDVEIFPHRLLNTDTAERLLNDLDGLEGIKRMVIQGPRLSPEESPKHRTLILKGEEITIQVKPGRILMEIDSEEVIEDIRDKCEDNIPFGYNIHVGRFIRKQKTVSDTLKYGEKLEDVSEELVGLTDQNAQLSDRAKILKKDKEE